MIYFIPSWYLKNEWKEDEQFWHSRRMSSETDDTVKQIQLFQRNDISDYRIMLLSYAPNFRHFLHRQSIYRAPYWSVFDSIQEVTRKRASLFSFHNVKWPKNIEFVHTPFALIAMLNGEKYAQVEFGEYGNTIQINVYKDGQLNGVNVYDDRGFASCTTVYGDGKKLYDQYLNENGEWKMCHFADGRVAINPSNNHYLIETENENILKAFNKLEYGSINEVIEEVLTSYLSTVDDNSIFCAALHNVHLDTLKKVLGNRQTIYSIFNDRISLSNDVLNKIAYANKIIVDDESNYDAIKNKNIIDNSKMIIINPYDTRSDYGISQKLHVQKILVAIDDINDDLFESIIVNLCRYLLTNKDARVHLFTRNAEYGVDTVILEKVKNILKNNDFPEQWARKEKEKKFEMVPDEEKIPILFYVEQCINELSVSKCVREQRVMIDLSNKADLFLQISCVSFGVPQILKNENHYMRVNKNGLINKDIDELPNDLKYYLESLNNWNNAMINSYKLSKENTTDYLVEQWKEVISSFERD